MAQTLTLSRAAHLIGISRTELQQRIHNGELPSFDGTVTAEDLLRAYPQAQLEQSGAFEKVVGIRDDAFAKRLRERVLPTQEVLARRLFLQAQELAEARRHLTRYHALLDAVRKRIDGVPVPAPAEIARLLDDGLADVLASNAAADAATMVETLSTVMRVMSAQVTLRPSGHEFYVDGSETLLKSALAAGLAPNYGCGNGTCGLCKCRVIEGEVRPVVHADYPFSAAERAQGFALMCCNTAVSPELVIEAIEAGAAADVPEQRLIARVRAIDTLGGDVLRLHLQTPRSNRLRFFAGQRVTLGLSGASDAHGDFPIASCPCDDRNLHFHLSRSEVREQAARFVHAAFAGQIKAGDDISVWGPWGDFTLPADDLRPLLFVAVDHGYAPIASLIEHALAQDDARPITLVWLSSQPGGIYLPNPARAWADAIESFEFLPVVADDPVAALAERLPEQMALAAASVYVAAPPADLDRLLPALREAGADPKRLRGEAC